MESQRKNPRWPPGTLSKLICNSEGITGSIHRSHYDKYSKILNFGRGNFAGQERNVADLDDGYARLSNMLLEAYSGADLTKRQFKVLLAILRKTYGWNKPMDRITDSQLSEITKLPVKRCNEAKLELVRMNIIKQQGGMFGPNKNISEWCIPQNEGNPLKRG